MPDPFADAPPIEAPPSEDALPCEGPFGMEPSQHRAQRELLISSLSLHLADRDDVFIGGNMFLYFSALQTKRNDFRGPDFFVVLGTDPRLRKSWVMWQVAKAPDVIVELTSPSTRDEDYGRKKTIYGQSLRVPHDFLFDPLTGHLDGFDLSLGKLDYVPLQPDPDGRLRCERLDLSLGVSDIPHRGQPGPWLRWFTPEGALVPTYDELAAQETARADEAAARADEAAARAEQEAEARRAADARVAELEAQLRALRGN
ncbi:MAG: Uma2 family endonuclease [Myxococcales bacterium]|nr:Uma2 family endonuclease [Myxococcales bacterium]